MEIVKSWDNSSNMLFVDFFPLRQPKIKERQTDDGKHNSVCYWIILLSIQHFVCKKWRQIGLFRRGGTNGN
jgi:hypothetical protein